MRELRKDPETGTMTDDTLVTCDLCDKEIGVLYYKDETKEDTVPQATISQRIGSFGDYLDICPKCRYFGATVEYLQWTLHPNKVSVDIIGALKSTLRICDNIKQYLNDIRRLIADPLNPETGKDNMRRAYETMTNIDKLADMARANDSIAIAELTEFGK